MCFFYFVKQNDRVGVSTNFLRQLPSFFVAYVSRRGTDKSRRGEFLSILAHIDTDQRIFTTKHEFGQRFDEMRLADSRGTDKHKGADGAIGVLQSETIARNSTGKSGDGTILCDHFLRECLLHALQTHRLRLFHAVGRHTAHHRYDSSNGIFVHHNPVFAQFLLPIFAQLLEFSFTLQHAVA